MPTANHIMSLHERSSSEGQMNIRGVLQLHDWLLLYCHKLLSALDNKMRCLYLQITSGAPCFLASSCPFRPSILPYERFRTRPSLFESWRWVLFLSDLYRWFGLSRSLLHVKPIFCYSTLHKPPISIENQQEKTSPKTRNISRIILVCVS